MNKRYTAEPRRNSRASKTRTASIFNKSAITDHMYNEDHVIDWENVKVIDRESDKTDRLMREAMDQEEQEH